MQLISSRLISKRSQGKASVICPLNQKTEAAYHTENSVSVSQYLFSIPNNAVEKKMLTLLNLIASFQIYRSLFNTALCLSGWS